MENHLKRVLNLVRKTGDTMVVVDKDGNDSFVVMDLDRYEMLLDAQIQTESESKPAVGANIWDVMQEAGDEGETWDIDQLNEEEFADLEKQYQAFARGNVEEAVEETQKFQKQEAVPDVENIAKNSDEDEYGEEQFYLEPVE
ncbi:MAG TPA: hypothetical protein VJB64_02430 [Patescibacteria group bacterium]|nr:hypothetical protein [Patescibacteria group bacterium]